MFIVYKTRIDLLFNLVHCVNLCIFIGELRTTVLIVSQRGRKGEEGERNMERDS